MSYRRSRARRLFDADIVGLLRTLSETYSKRCSSGSVREFALCGVVLLCSARLESYMEDLLADWAKSLNTPGVTTDKLPRRTRAFLLGLHGSATYRRYICYGDEADLLAKLELMIGRPQYEVAIDGRALPALPLHAIYTDRKYPSPVNLQRLFNRLGLSNVFDNLNRVARRDTRALLVSFNDLRTEMAHVGMPVGLTRDDIRRHIENIRSLVGYVDRVFYSLVAASVGQASWTV